MTFLRALGFLALGVSLSLPRFWLGAEESSGLRAAVLLGLKLFFFCTGAGVSVSDCGVYKGYILYSVLYYTILYTILYYSP